MTIEVIEEFIMDQSRRGVAVTIHFKDRNAVSCIFIQGRDYNELRSKNLWRIVHKSSAEKWKESQDINLTRIFNGLTFTRLFDERKKGQ